jgi:polysaccharide export outer membrane protein
MNTYRSGIATVLLVLLIVVTASAADTAAQAIGQDYVIGPGDVLEISVWKEEALTKLVTVLPDGKISFPLIGEAMASGWTVADLKKEIQTRLSQFVPDPVLSLSVNQMNSLMIYVVGKAKNPGRFILNTNVDVLQALAMAGGLNSFAKRGQIKVFRKYDGQTKIFDFDYDDVSEGKRLEQNIQLVRGDVIVVP